VAKYTTEELLEAFGQMSVLELSEFTGAFEEQFGVSAQAVVPAGPGVLPDGGDVAEEEQQTEFDVVLDSIGDKKIQVIKEVRAITGLGLKEAKDLVESAPVSVLKAATLDETTAAVGRLETAGASVTVR
jgi:large subunit ribosomal protein L7/L12